MTYFVIFAEILTTMNIIRLIPVALLCLALGGCSLFEKNVKADTTLPSDRHSLLSGARQEGYRSSALERGEISGDWLIETVMGNKAEGQDAPYLKFDPASHMVYGSNGCNTINAGYANAASDSTISFNSMVTTMRLCPGSDLSEQQINTALSLAARYTWSLKDGRYALSLYDAAWHPLMTLARQDFDFLAGTWTVEQIDGRPADNPDARLVLDIDEMRLHGNTGCNTVNGTIVTDMALKGGISFQNLASTRKTCPNQSQEYALLVALEAAAEVRPVDASTVDLLGVNGEPVLRLTRVK